jgi:8-oxo-dGTP diphosphatase
MREIKEETGLDVPVPKFAWVSNNPDMEGGRHYTTIFMQSKVGKGSLPLTMEPEKCEEWKWKSWSELKGECESGTLFQPLATVLKTEYDPFSSKVGVP